MNASTRLLGVETHWIRKVLTIAANRVLWVLFTSYCRIVCFFFMLTLLLIWSIVFPSFFLFSHLNSLYFRLLHKGLFRLFSLTMDMAAFCGYCHGNLRAHTPPMQPNQLKTLFRVEGGWAPKISHDIEGVDRWDCWFWHIEGSKHSTYPSWTWGNLSSWLPSNTVGLLLEWWCSNMAGFKTLKISPISSYSSVTRAQHTFQIERSQTWSGVIILPTQTMHY